MITSARRLIALVDDLQTELDSYIEERETFVQDYNDLLEENDLLRDQIADLMRRLNGSERN